MGKDFREVLNACPACESNDIRPWMTKDREGLRFNLWKCNGCGSSFMNPQPTRAYLEAIYAGPRSDRPEPLSLEQVMAAEREYPNSTVDAQRMVSFARKLTGSLRGPCDALDIGSGYGFYSRAALDAGFRVTAVNPGSWQNEIFAQINGFAPIPYFFEDVDFHGKYFDLVILSQVLEHFSHQAEILQKIKNVLKPHGVLAIAVPNVDSIVVKIIGSKDNSCLLVPDHMVHFSRRGLEALMQRTGFDIKAHRYVSRCPYYIMSNKLNLTGVARKMLNLFVNISQRPFVKVIDILEIGLYHYIWAQPF